MTIYSERRSHRSCAPISRRDRLFPKQSFSIVTPPRAARAAPEASHGHDPESPTPRVSRRTRHLDRGCDAARDEATRRRRRGVRPRRRNGLAKDPLREGVGGSCLAGRVRRNGLGRDAAPHLHGGADARERAAAVAVRSRHGRPPARPVRQRRAEAALPAEDPLGR